MTETTHHQIKIERTFEAPRALVFANWTDPQHLGAWFAPAGFDVVDCSVDHRPGGNWRIAYRSASGELYVEHGQFIESVVPEYLHFTLVNENERGDVMVRTEVKVDLQELEGKTMMTFVQTGFTSHKVRDSMAQGWTTCLDKLDAQVAAQRELLALFEDWFSVSEKKDLDGAMSPVAKDVVSYEHEAPLVYDGVDAIRAVCKAGFEHMPDGFRWEVPDLRIIVRGDVAVTWGLNRVRGPGVETWSRGTRILRKVDSRWQMIHQHVSFPYDPTTGVARLDLRP